MALYMHQYIAAKAFYLGREFIGSVFDSAWRIMRRTDERRGAQRAKAQIVADLRVRLRTKRSANMPIMEMMLGSWCRTLNHVGENFGCSFIKSSRRRTGDRRRKACRGGHNVYIREK
ncbi:hypothetical protein KCP76_20980 [Salmonella enterica subsp. enterica serovar Weltevreden]|nr:hypothetical protein KCP76_20980 [Salmonella enterica subsp. enterica serovar Weltevreden]